MSENRFDVMAVLQRMASQARAYRGSGAGPGSQQLEDELAVAAVDELIVTMAKIKKRATPHPDDTGADRKRDLYHIEALASRALANIGGAP